VNKTISKIGASVLINFPKSKLCIIVRNVIGFVRTYSYIHIRNVYTSPVRPNHKVFLPPVVYCTYFHINRSEIVHILLSYANLPAPPPSGQPANGSGTQRKQIQTMHTHTQYIQDPVHTQFTSPPGGESMYYSEKYMQYVLYKYMSKNRIYFTVLTSSQIMQIIHIDTAVCAVISTVKWPWKWSLPNSEIEKLSYKCILNSTRTSLSYKPDEHSSRRAGLKRRLTLIICKLHSLSSNCTHFSVLIRHFKMSEPGEDSQISRPMSAGEYPIYIPVFSRLVKIPVFSRLVKFSHYFSCMCLYCGNRSLVYGE
jgi:hypothetical protein